MMTSCPFCGECDWLLHLRSKCRYCCAAQENFQTRIGRAPRSFAEAFDWERAQVEEEVARRLENEESVG